MKISKAPATLPLDLAYLIAGIRHMIAAGPAGQDIALQGAKALVAMIEGLGSA